MSMFNDRDLTRQFSGTSLQRGRSYQTEGRVRDLAFRDGGASIEARVDGTAARPYRVEIAVSSQGAFGAIFETRCACPVGVDCKHAAAVLLEILARRRHGRPMPSPAAAIGKPPEDPLAGPVAGWLSGVATTAGWNASARSADTVLFILDIGVRASDQSAVIKPMVVRRPKAGGFGKTRPIPLSTILTSGAKYLRPEDRSIARLLNLNPWHHSSMDIELPDDVMLREILLARLVATGRCHWRNHETAPLTAGDVRQGRIAWRLLLDGHQVPAIETGSSAVVALPGPGGWYVDTETLSLGRFDLGMPAATASALLKAPPVAVSQVPALRAALAKMLPDLAFPMPDHQVTEEIVTVKPVPCLRFSSTEAQVGYLSWRPSIPILADVVELSYAYGGRIVHPSSPQKEFRHAEGRRVVVMRRDEKAEKAALRRLRKLGLIDRLEEDAAPGSKATGLLLTMPGAERWPAFVYEEVPRLTAEGWRVEFAPSFRHRVIDASGEWQADVADGNGGFWFSLDLGIEIQGRRVGLLPLLMQAIEKLGGAETDLAPQAAAGMFYARIDDGTLVALPLARVAPLVSVLAELFDTGALGEGGRLDLSLGEATGLVALEAAIGLRWLGGERLRHLATRLASFQSVAHVPVPRGLATELRPYQHQGLEWLQFLREYELGGILADDMGLGKTVQTLAHILTERIGGRLDRPCLVVCPTSLVPNWKAEAARFAPELNVVSLHGAYRAERFAKLATADLALTTYALLPRDEEALLRQAWHIVVLDEAQAIKNPAAKATLIACRLNARHRLCLTGTPVENHLGDLWSQFAFLMPGLLGDNKRFARVFRAPIERKGDTARQALLARRLRPFILRRGKSEVAAELPQKTLMTLPIELAGAQRDLYETVRLAMHEKVRAAVAERGLARSHIIILDALLKLRQVCCDPRLVKLAAAKQVAVSAKLAHLKEMLPQLAEEGRRVLLFSQFTGMLDLIEAEIETLGIPYVDLRGDTIDRATPVERFQRGEVPIFCLSLKAGGTGLNLTAADTVIHYDPWWNPAVEAQATDRAHRIGQDKPVFVYKLIAEGTIEQRMLELQDRKAALANGLFDPDKTAGTFEAADLELMFQPLE